MDRLCDKKILMDYPFISPLLKWHILWIIHSELGRAFRIFLSKNGLPHWFINPPSFSLRLISLSKSIFIPKSLLFFLLLFLLSLSDLPLLRTVLWLQKVGKGWLWYFSFSLFELGDIFSHCFPRLVVSSSISLVTPLIVPFFYLLRQELLFL